MVASREPGGAYVFSRDGEGRRLLSQSEYLEPLTERLLREVGVDEGMRVLDLGSGMGDVALIASRLVGPRGRVVGVEIAEATRDAAEQRVRAAGVSNVSFVHGDIDDLNVAGPFDAVVGRLILVHLKDPASVLRAAAAHVRPGGIVAFHEPVLRWCPSVPSAPLWEQVRGWILDTFARGGVDLDMGLKLHGIFVAAGLPQPAVTMDAIVGSGEGFLGYEWAVAALRGLLPAAVRLGVATEEEIDIETLGARLQAEARDLQPVIVCPPFVGAWARTNGPAT
jgi:SAM-dependent methyltransferase